MPYQVFYANGTEEKPLDDLEKLLTNPAVHVLWKVSSVMNCSTCFYVFYEDRIEARKQGQQDFMQKLKIAKEVSEDENYVGCEEKGIPALKNITQRKLYLLSHYGVLKSEADEIMALLTPEMAAIYKDYEQEVEEDVNSNQGLGFLPTD